MRNCLPRQNREQRWSSETAEQEPRHAAHTKPAERGQSECRANSKLHRAARLLGDPRRDRVDQLAVEEDHLEEHDRALYDEHLNYGSCLLRLDCFSDDLHAGEASRHEHEQEHPKERRHHAWVRIEPGETAEHFIECRLEREGEDRRFDSAPDGEYQECDPRHTGLEVTFRCPIEQRERRAQHAKQDVLDHQEGEAHRADDPADECDANTQHSGPEKPNAAAGIPPCHEH